MKIYVAHSRKFDFKNGLYIPLRGSSLDEKHELIMPHEFSDKPFSSKEFFRDECDLVVAEVSYKSTGIGIELGWASAYEVPIILLYKRGVKVASSLKTVSDKFVEYGNVEEMISGIEKAVGDKE